MNWTLSNKFELALYELVQIQSNPRCHPARQASAPETTGGARYQDILGKTVLL